MPQTGQNPGRDWAEPVAPSSDAVRAISPVAPCLSQMSTRLSTHDLTGVTTTDVGTITRGRELLPANDRQFGLHRRRDETIVGKTVEIGAGQACDQFYTCIFIDCEIRLRAEGRLVSVATQGQVFKDCLVSACVKQCIPNWEAGFERCYFRGKFETRFAGTVVDCDFSAATLCSATFLQPDSLGAVEWPKWPHIVIESPNLNYEDWSRIAKPDEFNRFLVRKSGRAIVINLANAVNDPDGFWELIRHKEYVHTRRDA